MLRRTRPRRALATVLFTDIVGSTSRAEELGDAAWRALLARHHRIIRRLLRRHGGREIDTAGDGFFATFAQPADAIACALEAADQVAALGVEIRAGIHTGEVEPMGAKVGGIAVHLGARILGAAQPGQIVVSGTVRDLVAGAGFSFRDLGTQSLKGVADEWHLYAVDRPVRVGPAPVTDDAPAAGRVSRRSVLLALGLVGLVLASGTVAFLVARGLGSAVGSDGPNLVQAVVADGSLGDAFPVGRGPNGVDVADGVIWIANTYGGTVGGITTGGASAAVVGAGAPTQLVVQDGVVWVLDPFAPSVAMVSADDGRVLETIEVRGRAIAANQAGIWVADDISDVVYRIDPRSRSVVATISLPAGSGPAAIAASDDAVWVVNELSGTMSRIDPATNAVSLEALAVLDVPSSVAAGPEGVWAASVTGDAIFRIDPSTNRVVGVGLACDQPTDLDVLGAGAVVICAGERSVIRIAPDGGEAIRTALDAIPIAVATDGDRVWVTLRDS